MLTQVYALNGGEISRRLWSRSDLERYYSSVADLTNFQTLRYGGITRRAGFEHVDTFGAADVRLIPFRYSAGTAFVLAFTDGLIRFYTNGAVVTSGGIPVEVVSPYLEADLPNVRYEQIGNVIYLTHPSYAPRTLTRVSDTSWTLATFALSAHPFKDENTVTTLTVTPSATTGTGVTLTASAALWDAEHVGARWRIGHVRAANTVSVALTGTGNSSSLLIQGDYVFRTSGTWAATVAIQESLDGSTWETVQSWAAASDTNITFNGYSDRPIYVRASVTAYTSSSGTPSASVDALDTVVWGSALITARASSTSVTVTIEEPLFSTGATYYHAEGSWSAAAGYPRQVLLHEGRLWFAGTTDEPLTLWASAVDEYNDFRRLAGAPDLAIQRTLYSATADQIQWMVSRGGAIIVGTAGDEWVIRNAADLDNAEAAKSTAYGSADVAAVELNDSLLFIERREERMRDYIGLDVQRDDLARDPYAAGDLTRVAEHITKTGIKQMAVSQQPDPIIWAVVNGNLIGLTYDRAENVMGWHRHTVSGTVMSVATIPGTYGDEVWIAVTRAGQSRIERMHPATPENALAGLTSDCLFLDAGKLVNLGTPGTVVSGLDHLNGMTVDVLVDGGTHPQAVVSGGFITLERAGTKIAVGLPVVALVELLPLVAQTQSGSTRNLIGRVSEVTVDIHQTFGLEYADSMNGRWYALTQRIGTDDPMLPPPLRSEPVQLPVAGAYSRAPRIKMRQAVPLPATILGLSVSWEATER